MSTHSSTARKLAIVAGIAATGGALAILCGDVFTTGHWSLDHALMPVIVGITILAGHLVGKALRSFKIGSAAGFALLFVLGTGLTVYTSVGRQAKTADTEVASVEANNAAIEEAHGELKNARRRLADAESMIAKETGKGGCGKICKDWTQRANEVRSHIALQVAGIERLGAKKPVAPRADRAAEVISLFGIEKTTAKRYFQLFEPFAYSLFLELAAIVAFGFGFGHKRNNQPERVEVTPEPGPVVAAPSTPTERRAAVHSFVAAHIVRHGHPPQLNDMQAMHRDVFGLELAKSTASRWRIEAEAKVHPVRMLRVVG